ncbi:MAG: hypothetical protein U1E46_14525 [Hyphomicrobiales bacterium]
MQRLSNDELMRYFLGWQCRVRQIAVRDFGGMPTPGMRPSVWTKKGELVLEAMTVLLAEKHPRDTAAFFRFQVQKTNEAEKARQAGLRFLGAEYFQQPELFTGELTAVFAPGSETAARLVKLKEVLLAFEQFSQRFRMFSKVRALKAGDGNREATLWHNRLFNPNVPNDAVVLAFRPDWKNTEADPWPAPGNPMAN